jgi:hypothetical protein
MLIGPYFAAAHSIMSMSSLFLTPYHYGDHLLYSFGTSVLVGDLAGPLVIAESTWVVFHNYHSISSLSLH